jgi:hypothetical protein
MRKLVVNEESRFVPIQTACGILNTSRNTMMRLADEAGAVVRFGRSVRIDTKKLIAHVEETCSGN